MSLSSLFKRKAARPAAAVEPAADDSAEVQEARARARRRLIGAALLLLAGVVGLPLLFETQPRPLPADIPIEMPRKDGAARTAPLPPLPSGPAAADAAHNAAKPEATRPADETAAAGKREYDAAPVESRVAEAKPEQAAAKPAEARGAASRPEPRPVAAAPKAVAVEAPAGVAEPKTLTTEPKTVGTESKAVGTESKAVAAESKTAATESNPREQATPASAAASDARGGRFVVQVGAYTDPNTLRDVRAKVEKLGLKTYTQTIETDAGKRTRVRVGPYVTRDEADSASAKLKAAGLPGNVLVL